jgi:hypothetical protein
MKRTIFAILCGLAASLPTAALAQLDPAIPLPNAVDFRDVSPQDWAFEALMSLRDRYDCLVGYPDNTFRGNRPLSRYEFAAGLNACLTQLEREIRLNQVSPEDLATLERLMREFEAELVALSDRVDTLEARVGFLEHHQFSTTTKLNGLLFTNLTGATASGDIKVETDNINTPLPLRSAARNSITNQSLVRIADDPEITLSYLSWINLTTSFTSKDNLVMQLVAGNGNSPANAYASAGLYNSFGVPFTDQTGLAPSDVTIRELFYSFPVGDRVQVTVGPRINWYRHFDANAYTFFLTGAGSFNSSGSTLTNGIDRGAGAVVQWQVNDLARLSVGYLGENNEFLPSQFGFNTASNPAQGLFGATNTTTVELALNPLNSISLSAFYNYSRLDNNIPIFDQNGNRTGFGVGGSTSEPFYGIADDGFGGTIEDAPAHTFGVNGSWTITPNLGIFGRYTYGITHINPTTANRPDGEIRGQSLQLGVAFPDLGKEGALATLSYLLPFSILDGRNYLVSGGGNGGVQYELEATYFYPLTANISLVPAFYFIGNANNFSDNPNIYVFNLRTQFSF